MGIVRQMEIKVDLEANAVNDAIAKAVVESRLGVALKERIESFLNEKHHYNSLSFSDAMTKAVDAELKNIVIQLINTEYREAIQQKVREKLSDEVLWAMVDRAMERLRD